MNAHDEFAAAALIALVARQTTRIETPPAHRAIAKIAYDMADAMMAERKKRLNANAQKTFLEPSISEQCKMGV